jgi:hypothetical protein
MNILVLQHLTVDHPGIFRSFMRADGVKSLTKLTRPWRSTGARTISWPPRVH